MTYSDQFPPGHRLGKYEIIRELATGGMARIYLARVVSTAGFEKLVVLKCILPGLARDPGFLTMFLDEARLAARLQHANIADVFDVGVENETYFFAMEYVHGQNARALRLEARHRGLDIPLEVSFAIITGTAAALAYAHDRTGPDGPLGIVHRDVSPSNVLVGYEGAVKLVDFGIARASMRRGTTRTGLRRGKAPYMSPEQCRGYPMDRRSDLFSLGTMLYELTTGTRPFRGHSDFEVMDEIVRCQPELPSQLVPSYPRRLEQIVMRLLAPAPQDRYQNAIAMLEDLEALIASSGMLPSSHAVAKFMRELFGDTVTARVDRDTFTDTASNPTQEDVQPDLLLDDEEPTERFRRAHLWTPELRDRARHKRALSDGDEQTRKDAVLLFDPISARSVELLSALDADAPDDETPEARALRRIDSLLHQASHFLVAREADKAVTAVELALEEDLHVEATQQLLHENVLTIIAAYEALLQDPYRQFALTQSIADLAGAPMEQRARLLVPFIDGQATISQVLERSGMLRLEAYHHLSQLLLRGIIQ